MKRNADVHSSLPGNRMIAARLRLGRRDAALVRHEVSERLGWPTGHLASLELGRRLPLLSEVVALARLYRLDVEFFRPVGSDENPEPDAIPAVPAASRRPSHRSLRPGASGSSPSQPVFSEAA